jgi:hypothetical protein
MTDEKCWELIKSFNWGKSFDYVGIQKLIQKLEPDQIKELQKFCDARVSDLYDRFEEFGRTKVVDDGYEFRGICYYGVGDDSLSDLIAHIVGLGESEFNKVMKNPELARKRAARQDYKENFLYSFSK